MNVTEQRSIESHDIDYDALGPHLIGRRVVHFKHGEAIIKSFAFDQRSERNLLSVTPIAESESRDMHERIWREWITGPQVKDPRQGRRHHGPLTFKIPVEHLIKGTDRYSWCLIPEQVSGVDVEITQERILDSIVNIPLTLDRETLISKESRLSLTTGPQSGYYLGYLDLDSEYDLIDRLTHGVDYAASAAINYLNRGSRKANRYWVSQHLTDHVGDLWDGILRLGLRDDLKESFARICVILTKSAVADRDDAEETALFARRIIEATEQRILGHLGNEIALLHSKSAT